MNKLLILGAGGNGKVCAEIASLNSNYEEICFLDDNINIKEVLGYKVIGQVKQWVEFEGYDFFVSFGDNIMRSKYINILNENLTSLIHPSAIISSTATIGLGSVIMPNVVVMPNSHIGRGCILNTASTVDHDCIIGDFSHLSPGVNIGGSCFIGSYVWIGLGAKVINNIKIGLNAIVGAGTVVIRDVNANTKVIGTPAREI